MCRFWRMVFVRLVMQLWPESESLASHCILRVRLALAAQSMLGSRSVRWHCILLSPLAPVAQSTRETHSGVWHCTLPVPWGWAPAKHSSKGNCILPVPWGSVPAKHSSKGNCILRGPLATPLPPSFALVHGWATECENVLVERHSRATNCVASGCSHLDP